MPATLSALDKELRLMLGSACQHFSDPAALRVHLTLAIAELQRLKPLIGAATLTLTADTADYDPPADMAAPLATHWLDTARRDNPPWQAGFPPKAPRLHLIGVGAAIKLRLTPPPSAQQIALFGAQFPFEYVVRLVLSDDPETANIPPDQQDLLLRRALIFALETLAIRGLGAPVTLGGSGGSAPRNGMPAYLAKQLLDQWLVAVVQ